VRKLTSKESAGRKWHQSPLEEIGILNLLAVALSEIEREEGPWKRQGRGSEDPSGIRGQSLRSFQQPFPQFSCQKSKRIDRHPIERILIAASDVWTSFTIFRVLLWKNSEDLQ
jgi:hypothetical protein